MSLVQVSPSPWSNQLILHRIVLLNIDMGDFPWNNIYVNRVDEIDSYKLINKK